MPMYEYQCQKCGLHFDVEQRMIDDPIKIHEGCGGDVVKVFSSAGIVLKGSGFYKTDARSGSATKKAAPKPSTDTSSEKKSSESSKPAATDSKKSESSGSSNSEKKPAK